MNYEKQVNYIENNLIKGYGYTAQDLLNLKNTAYYEAIEREYESLLDYDLFELIDKEEVE